MLRQFSNTFGALTSVIVLAGCAHTQAVADPAALEHLNGLVGRHPATVVLCDGASFHTRALRFGPDSTAWRAGDEGVPSHAVATSDVASFTIRSRPRGALDGLFIGLAIGAPLGVLIIDNPNGAASDLGNRMEAGAAGGVAFAIWGAPIGLIVGSPIRFTLKNCSHNPNTLLNDPRQS